MESWKHIERQKFALLIHMLFIQERDCVLIHKQHSIIVAFMKFIQQINIIEPIKINEIQDINYLHGLEAHFAIQLKQDGVFNKVNFIKNNAFFIFKTPQLHASLDKLRIKYPIEMIIQIFQGRIVFSRRILMEDLKKHTKQSLQKSLKNIITKLQVIIKDFFNFLLQPPPKIDEKIFQFDINNPQASLRDNQVQILNRIQAQQAVNFNSLTFSTFVINIENFAARESQFLKFVKYIVPFRGNNNVIELCEVIKDIGLCDSANPSGKQQNIISSLKTGRQLVRKRVPYSQQIRKFQKIQKYVSKIIQNCQERMWKEIASIYQRRDDKYKIPHYLELKSGIINQKANFLLMEYLPRDAFPNQTPSRILSQDLQIISQILSRIIHLVSQSVIHNDMKPLNLRYDDNFNILKLADFEGTRIYSQHILTKIDQLIPISFPIRNLQEQIANVKNFMSIVIEISTPYIKNRESTLRNLASTLSQQNIQNKLKNTLNILKEIIDSTTLYISPILVKNLRQNINKFKNGQSKYLTIKPQQLRQLADKFYDLHGLPHIIQYDILPDYNLTLLSKREKLCLIRLCIFKEKLEKQLNTNKKIMNISKIPIIIEYLSSILRRQL